jgi:hypothetical protein
MHEILQNVGYKNDPAAGEELLFGNWLIQNLAEIRQDYQHHHFEMAVTKARALNSAIEKQCEQSPVLQVIQASIMNQVLILETAGELQTRALQADQMRQQIGTIIGLVNARPMSSGQSEKIDQNLDDSWISDLDFLKKIPTEKKNNAGSTGSF